MADLRHIPISELVPHASPMCLLDRAIEGDDEHLIAEAEIRPDHLFLQGDAIGGWVGIEYMAQAVAAWAGLRSRQRGEPPRLGFLLGSRRYECHWPLIVLGSKLRIEVRLELLGDSGIGSFECRIDCGDQAVARALLTVFEPSDALAFLNSSSQQGPDS